MNPISNGRVFLCMLEKLLCMQITCSFLIGTCMTMPIRIDLETRQVILQVNQFLLQRRTSTYSIWQKDLLIYSWI